LTVLPQGRRSSSETGLRLHPTERNGYGMHEVINILSMAAFANIRRMKRGAFENVQPGCLRLMRLKPRGNMVASWMNCFSDFSLWFSLPLSIWLSTGWVGLIFHCQAIATMACRPEVALGGVTPIRQRSVGR